MEQLFQNIQSFIVNFIQQVHALSPWLAAAAVVIFGAMYAFGGQQTAQMAKTRGVQVVVGIGIIWLVSAVINTLIGLFGANNINRIHINMVVDQMILPFIIRKGWFRL